MNCSKCEAPMDLQVSVHMKISADMENLLSKTNIRDKRVEILGVSWDKARYICPNIFCNYVFREDEPKEPVRLSEDVVYKAVNYRCTTGGMDWGQTERLAADTEELTLKANGLSVSE